MIETVVLVAGYSVGLIFEIVGVLLMANAYLKRASDSAVPMVLMSALWRGDTARGAAFPGRSDVEGEKRANLVALQGLAFIGVGFVFQSIVGFFTLIWGS